MESTSTTQRARVFLNNLTMSMYWSTRKDTGDGLPESTQLLLNLLGFDESIYLDGKPHVTNC